MAKYIEIIGCRQWVKPYPCHMPLLHKNLSVIVFWLTFTQPQLIGWLAYWLEADLLTDLLTSLLTNLLTNWLAYCFNYWLADWLTDCVANRLVDLLATILVTNHWNKTHFSWIFGKFCTFTLHTFVLTLMCPSPSPMLSHAYFGALRRL